MRVIKTISIATSLAACLDTGLFAAEKTNSSRGSVALASGTQVDTGLSAEYNETGGIVYYRRSGSNIKPITQIEFQDSLATVLEQALRIVCKLPMRPRDVTASAGIFSATWSVGEDVCKDKK